MADSASSGSRRWWLLVAGLFFVAGAGLRLHNAWVYDIDMGFDAPQNWQYVEILLRTGRLPAPETGWSTGHPPFFYAMAAGIALLMGGAGKSAVVVATRLASSVIGLLAVAALGLELHRREPGRSRRIALAVGLVLVLPVHVMMSAMFSEELLTASLVSFCLLGLARDLDGEADLPVRRAVLWGAFAGLAWLTKLTGALAALAGTLACLLWARPRSRAWRPAAAFAGAAGVLGGWFYLRNLLLHGYLYPYGLPAHRVMFSMPPGGRGLLDYLAFPLSLFCDPDLLSPALLHSVWGSTYLSVWLDPHGHFLPQEAPGLPAVATALLLLGLIPTAAFVAGWLRALAAATRRALGPTQGLWLGYTTLTLAGYVAFTWRNPWFVTVKGSFLLSLLVPYGWWASDVLDRVMTRSRAAAWGVLSLLLVLWLLVHVTFFYEGWLDKRELPGIPWQPVTQR